MAVEGHHKGLVKTGSHRVLQEAGGCVLLKVKTAVHGSTHVDEQSYMERKISFAAEVQDGLRRFVIVQDTEIRLVQVAYKLPVLIGCDKEDVHLVHAGVKGDDRVLRLVWIRVRSRTEGVQRRYAGYIGRLGVQRDGSCGGCQEKRQKP